MEESRKQLWPQAVYVGTYDSFVQLTNTVLVERVCTCVGTINDNMSESAGYLLWAIG